MCIQPRRPELPHAGVDHRVAGLTTLPGGEHRRVGLPVELLPLAAQRQLERLRLVRENMPSKLAPPDLAEIHLDALRSARIRGDRCATRDRTPDLTRTELAETQVR